MRGLPVVESICTHRGDFAQIAAWLLDCLDSLPPPAGGYLVLYLCYHASDRSSFSSPHRNAELEHAILERYEQERHWDGMGFGDLRFTLTRRAGPVPLSINVGTGRNIDQLKAGYSKGPGAKSTPIAFHWQETEFLTTAGTLTLTRRRVEPMKLDMPLTASLRIASDEDIVIASHVDVWQGQMRGPLPTIYLPKGRTAISLGGTPGCDVHAARFNSPLLVEFDDDRNEWTWATPMAPWLPSGHQPGELILDYQNQERSSTVVLRGQRLSAGRKLSEIRDENRLPKFVLEIIGCLLPSPLDDGGYGVVGVNQAKLAGLASSAVQLPYGAWLYLSKDTSKPYLLRAGEALPGRVLGIHQIPQDLTLTRSSGPQRQAKWLEDPDIQSPLFRGELRLMPPITSRLVADSISCDLPNEVFADYVDSTLGRPPIRLESGDGRTYALAFNESARHPVFLFSNRRSSFKRYEPSTTAVIELGAAAEFVLGATHYRLRQLASVEKDDPFASPLASQPTGDSL